jgi:acyl-CoA synthetase (AMP-forming)/AMP-acid ligase II
MKMLYPAEVELVIDELPEIAEVAVVGYKDEETGEVPHAYIVFHEGMSLEKEQIMKHCRKELARYKIPRSINFVSELPKTLVGKIDKKAIVAKYLANEDK